MGGHHYTRAMYVGPSGHATMTARSLDRSVDPRGKTIECPENQTPIVVAMDVTGSMGEWSKIIYDKMPMFFGQMMMEEYCDEPCISFVGVGDAVCDMAPLQVSDFGSGATLDKHLKAIWLEGGGGGATYGEENSYDLAAAYYASSAVTVPKDRKGFFFITGDEGVYEKPHWPWFRKWVCDDVRDITKERDSQTFSAGDIFTSLKQRFHVFHLKKAYDTSSDARILRQWQTLLGEPRVLVLDDPKSVVDIMLGAVALTSETRTLEQYLADMEERGQTTERVSQVKSALAGLAEEIGFGSSP